MDLTASLISYADRAFCYAVCAFLLVKYGTAIDAVKGAVEKLETAITLLASRKD